MPMTNREIRETALRQSAWDCHCQPEDFLREENVVTLSEPHPQARRYLPLPLECDLVSYGGNIVAQVSGRTAEAVRAYIGMFPAYGCFETPGVHRLDALLAPFGLKVCFMALYYLPDVTRLEAQTCGCTLRILPGDALDGLYQPEWSHCLTFDEPARDVLAVGAYDGEKLVGLAGCSADCEEMWQIGVDVLPTYRRKGIGAAVTSRLALEILAAGKVPFYCAAWSNIRSAGNAIRCGFRPAWAELTARPAGFVEEMLRQGHAEASD